MELFFYSDILLFLLFFSIMYLEVLPVVLSRIKDIDKKLIALGFETEKSTLIVYRVFEGVTSLKLKYLDKQYLVLNLKMKNTMFP